MGKSTSLAKIAYYLQSNQCTPLLAACDTFRSGAVEQLSVHASCLSIPLYHQGYAKDPSAVAKASISKATDDGNDVVLIDTAGRMQVKYSPILLKPCRYTLQMKRMPTLLPLPPEQRAFNEGIGDAGF